MNAVIPEVSVLIPAYHEERHIAAVVAEVLAQRVGHVLVVDDGSTDATAERARAAGAEVIRHPVNRGKGAALQTGLRHLLERPRSTYVLIMDGDGQHRADEIGRFVAATEHHPTVRLLVGNRMGDLRTMPLVRRWTNQVMSALISHVCGQRVPDTQCGFRLVRRDLIPLLLGRSSGFDYETEVLILTSWHGNTIVPVAVSTIYGEEVSSIRPWRDTVRFLRLVARYWVQRGHRFGAPAAAQPAGSVSPAVPRVP